MNTIIKFSKYINSGSWLSMFIKYLILTSLISIAMLSILHISLIYDMMLLKTFLIMNVFESIIFSYLSYSFRPSEQKKSYLAKFLDKRTEMLSELNPYKFTHIDIARLFSPIPKFMAKYLCNMAVKQKLYEKYELDGETFYRLKK